MPSRSIAVVVLFLVIASLPFQLAAISVAANQDSQAPPSGAGTACRFPLGDSSFSKIRVALVNSIFTSSAYTNVLYPGPPGFYNFYLTYKHTPDGARISTDLSWMTVPLSAARVYNGGWGATFRIYKFMSSDLARQCGLRRLATLNETQVDAGALFGSNGTRAYDVVVMGKTEYVTTNELDQYAQFVREGGRLVLMHSDNFEAQVKLGSCPGPCETFVNGHGWTFTNVMIHTRIWNAFRDLDSKLTASLLPEGYYLGPDIGPGRVNTSTPIGKMLYRTFGPVVLENYPAHEESRLVNKTASRMIISFSFGISSFVHRYGRGDVVCFCLEGDNVIKTDATVQYFLLLAISTWTSAGPTLHEHLNTGGTSAFSAGVEGRGLMALQNPPAHTPRRVPSPAG